jgi:drug/metabolite transporter (DMT)-like permease
VAIVAFALLFFKKNREVIFAKTREAKPETTGFFMLGRILNMAGSLFLYFAVFLGSIVLANALQGLQYVFVLILALILFKKIPSMKEHFSRELLLQKIVAVLMICLGLAILVI